MNDELESLLTFDVVAHAEKNNLLETGLLASACLASHITEKALQAAGDTHHGMSMKEFLDCCKKHGFGIVYEEAFHGRNAQERMYILWDGKKLINCETYNGTSLNGGHCYFAVPGMLPNGPISGHTKNGISYCYYDVRQGLFYWLSKIEEFVTPIEVNWLSNYMDFEGERPYQVRRQELIIKSRERAARLPKHVFECLEGERL